MVELYFSAVTLISSRPVSLVSSKFGAALTADSKLPNKMRHHNIGRNSWPAARDSTGRAGELDGEPNLFLCITTVSQCLLSKRQGITYQPIRDVRQKGCETLME